MTTPASAVRQAVSRARRGARPSSRGEGGQRRAAVALDGTQRRPVDLRMGGRQRVDVGGAEQRQVGHPASGAEPHGPPLHGVHPAQPDHVVEVGAAHPDPVGRLGRGERRLLGHQAGQIGAGAHGVHLVGVEQLGGGGHGEVGEQPALDEPADHEGGDGALVAAPVAQVQGGGDAVGGGLGGDRLAGHGRLHRLGVHRLDRLRRPLPGGRVRSRDDTGVPGPPERGGRHTQLSGDLVGIVSGASCHRGSSFLGRPGASEQTVTEHVKGCQQATPAAGGRYGPENHPFHPCVRGGYRFQRASAVTRTVWESLARSCRSPGSVAGPGTRWNMRTKS
ncbi:protein of unknown function (plasmid) [Streptantibioticus cattleyicolor NRRL 8057 = DSM 46488]|nr:protein of unknown function [Streptantibioticus cattleyicolor NRRL 8057 = DSM 46488]